MGHWVGVGGLIPFLPRKEKRAVAVVLSLIMAIALLLLPHVALLRLVALVALAALALLAALTALASLRIDPLSPLRLLLLSFTPEIWYNTTIRNTPVCVYKLAYKLH